MKNLKQLKEERASLIADQQTIVDTARTEKREMNADEETRFDDSQTALDALESKIQRAEKIEAAEKRAASNTPPAVHTKKAPQVYSLTKAVRSAMDGKALDGVEKEAAEEAANELRSSGLDTPHGTSIGIPSSMMESRGQSVTGDAGVKGGKLVIERAPRMVAPLFPNNPLEVLGITHLSGLVGNVPLLSHTDVAFTWATENEEVTTKSDAKFEGPVLKPKRVVAVVDISTQLILQSSVGIEAMIIGMLNDAYGRTLAGAVLNGAGGKAPTGILNLIGVNDAAMSSAANPTYAEIVKLETMIEAENATDKSLAYVTNKTLKGKLKTTPIVSGDSVMLTKGDMLNGAKLVSTNLVPGLSGNQPLIYGDWKQVFTGNWGGISIQVDPLTQATSGKVRLIVNAYADVQVVHPKAFAFNKKFTV